jgi:hypothetical protein
MIDNIRIEDFKLPVEAVRLKQAISENTQLSKN